MKNPINQNQTERNVEMENVAQFQITQLVKTNRPVVGRRKSRNIILPKFLAFFRSAFVQPDLDYATFERLEAKSTRQAMRRNGLY